MLHQQRLQHTNREVDLKGQQSETGGWNANPAGFLFLAKVQTAAKENQVDVEFDFP